MGDAVAARSEAERGVEGGGAKEPAGAAFVAPEPLPPGCTCKRMPYERLPTPPRDGCLVHGRSHEAMGVEPVVVARSLDQMGARIARVERSCVALERRAFPERLVYSPSTGTTSLADRLRDGWSRGFHLVGLTEGAEPDPIWDINPRGSAAKRALIEASGKLDECADRLSALKDSLKAAGTLPDVVFHINDIAVTLGDESAACAKAAREAR